MTDSIAPDLDVRVAEALGWQWAIHRPGNASIHPGQRFLLPLGQIDSMPHLFSHAKGDEPEVDPSYRNVPRFRTDWAATGPLIEEHKIELEYLGSGFWRAYTKRLLATGSTPLLAACELLIYLSPVPR